MPPRDEQAHPAIRDQGIAKHCPNDKDDAYIRACRRNYHACIAEMDELVGDTLAECEKHGFLDNTWILFISDHGNMQMEHGCLWGKGEPLRRRHPGADHHPSARRPLGPASASAPLRRGKPASPRSTRLWRAGAPSLYGGILAMTLRPAEGEPDVHPYVVRVEDGETFDCAVARDHAAAWPDAGSPVVVNGWVVVPHQAGWACLAGSEP